MNADTIYRVIKNGTPAECKKLVGKLPPSPFADMAVSLLDSEQPGMRVVALSPAVMGYCNGGAPEVGASLASGLHQRAVELYESKPDHDGLIATTLSGLADNFVKASNLLGRSKEVIEFTDQYIPYYKKLGEGENLPALKLGRIAALLNLNRVDEAAEALSDPELPGNPATDIELHRLRGRLDQLRTTITKDRSQSAPPPGPVSDDFVARAQAAIKQMTTGLPEEAKLKGLIDKLSDAPRLDPNTPDGFKSLLEALKMGDDFLRRGATGDSELSMRGRVRDATAIFALQKHPPPEQIRKSLADLEQCLAWAHSSGIVELENDALYGIYLCHSRLKDPSAAADALLQLRRNLEVARSSIKDVVKRGGAFSLYPHLFAASCEKLYASGRFSEMLESIEASKGRGVADLLTERSEDAVADETIYTAAARLPELCRQHDFHYVTYFVDDEQTYAVLVTSDGRIHAPAPARLSRAAIRQAAESPVNPKTADVLSPLVAWLEPFLNDGTISRGAHLCVAADDDLANVPFAYLPLRGKALAQTLSTSRIHNAFHLSHVLDADSGRPEEYVGVIVPTRQNIKMAGWEKMHANLLKPITFLADTLPGETLEGASASPDALTMQDLSGRVVHFSTHGMFGKSETPFEHSGLILADGESLPDGEAVDLETVLTPRRILDDEVDLTGSHVSMMACVSGLSREGVGGDALGLEWAMIQAGAASVLSTHWKVRASLAATFLVTFYEEWLGKKRSRADALNATIASLKAAGGPAGETASWAAFSLMGDWR